MRVVAVGQPQALAVAAVDLALEIEVGREAHRLRRIDEALPVRDGQRGDASAPVRVLDRKDDVAGRPAVEVEHPGRGSLRGSRVGREGRRNQLGAALAAVPAEKLHHVVFQRDSRQLDHRDRAPEADDLCRVMKLRHEPHLLDERPLVQGVEEGRALRHRESPHHGARGPEARLDQLEPVRLSGGVLDADEEHPPSLLNEGPRGSARREAHQPSSLHGKAGERVAVEECLGRAHCGAVIAERHRPDLRGVLRGQRGAEARELVDRPVDACEVRLRVDFRARRSVPAEQERGPEQQRDRSHARDRDHAAAAQEVFRIAHGENDSWRIRPPSDDPEWRMTGIFRVARLLSPTPRRCWRNGAFLHLNEVRAEVINLMRFNVKSLDFSCFTIALY
jgi:hypothetical protein